MASDAPTVTNQSPSGRVTPQLWRWIWGLAAFVFFAVTVTGMFIRMPYVVFSPGEAVVTESRLEILCDAELGCIESFPSDGEVLFTTVSVRHQPSLWEYLWLKTNNDVEFQPAERILGDKTSQQVDRINADLMAESKDVAVAVALERLGYDVISAEALFVGQVFKDQPADGALRVGDQLVSVGGAPIVSIDDLTQALSPLNPGDDVDIVYKRINEGPDVAPVEVTITLGTNPNDSSRAFIGIAPFQQYDFAELDFDIEIDSSTVGGPSAGLAFTLAVLDYVTEGDLTGGVPIAVTGSIQADGSVGRIGGVRHKAAAVKEQGIEVFLVPASLPESEIAEAEAQVGSAVEIVPVRNLEEALVAIGERGGDISPIDAYQVDDL